MESSRRDGYDGYFTWVGALLQPDLWGIHPKIAISGHKAPIFIRDNDMLIELAIGVNVVYLVCIYLRPWP